MTCRRCRGLLVKEQIGVHVTRIRTPILIWRCLICGHRTDLLIEVNRWRCRPPAIQRARKEPKTLFSPAPARAVPPARHEPPLALVIG